MFLSLDLVEAPAARSSLQNSGIRLLELEAWYGA